MFCWHGYARTQIADIAKEMKVAVGTVYLYVESKEALFDLVVRFASTDDPAWLDELEPPFPTPTPGATLEFLRGLFDRDELWPELEAALASERAADLRAELEAVVREQYRLARRHRHGLALLARSAFEFPGLSEVFIFGLRQRLLEKMSRYIAMRAASRQFRNTENPFASAAVLNQAITWANLQRPYDPGLMTLDDTAVEDETVALLVNGLIAP